MTRFVPQRFWQWSVLAGGSLLFLTGCDETLQATLEDGVINTSSAFVGSLLRALLELAAEAQTAAMMLPDALRHLFG